MKNFITLSKLLAISSAHHSVTGFMLPEHLLHCICYFSNGAPKIQKQRINVIRRFIWKQKSLAEAQLFALLQDKFNYNCFPFGATILNIWLTPVSPTNKTCKSIFKKIRFCWCEKLFYMWQGSRDHSMPKYFRYLNQIFSTGNFLGLRLQDLAFGSILKFKI